VDNSAGAKFILKAISPAGKHGVLTLDKPIQGPVITMWNPIATRYNANADILASFQNNQSQGVVIASMESAKELKPVKVMGATDNYKSSNLGGAGHADQVILGDAFKNAPTLFNRAKRACPWRHI